MTTPALTTNFLLTVGYDERLGDLVEIANATIIDVRARPNGRVRKGWSTTDLRREFADRYEWWPALGGRAFLARSDSWLPAPTDVLLPLVERVAKENLILLCACDEPWNCHRHNELAVPLLGTGVETHHVFEDQLILASELQDAIANGQPYEHFDLCNWLGNQFIEDPENP